MTNNKYDAIVVGARCGGASVAMLLARQGYRVLLADKAKLPSDKPLSTHFLVCSGSAALQRWGLLDEVIATGLPVYHSLDLDFHGQIHFQSDSPATEGVDTIFAPRRFVMDEILLRAAVQAGVEVRDGFAIEDVLRTDGRVTGIRGRFLGQTELHDETASIVIGADGIHSVVAQLVGAEKYQDQPTASAVWFSYWSGVPSEKVRVFFRPSRQFVTYGTNDGRTIAMVYLPVSEASAFKQDIEGNFYHEFRTHVPELAAELQAGKREEKWIGTDHQPNYYRQSYGPGWALVGDAATHHDSINPTGITNAFTCAEFLAEAIHQGLSGVKDIDAALAEYQERRDRRWLDHFHFISQFAKLEPPSPEMAALIGKLAEKPGAAAGFGAFFQGHEDYLNFFAPENLQQVMA